MNRPIQISTLLFTITAIVLIIATKDHDVLASKSTTVEGVSVNGLVFTDDFSNGLGKWEPTRDSGQFWQVVDGELVANVEPNFTITELVPKDEYWNPEWKNFAYSFDFTGIDGVDKNISFHFEDLLNWYEVHFFGSGLELVRVKDGQVVWSVFKSSTIGNNSTHRITLVVREATISLFVDDQMLFEETDPTYDENYGKIGLKASTGSVAPTVIQVDNVEVKLLPPEIHFLRLPIEYTGDPAREAMGNHGTEKGRVNSWFDHQIPKYLSTNEEVWPWHGKLITGTTNVVNCTPGYSCYDGHTGIDFQKQSASDNVVAAADGKVVFADDNKDGFGNSVLIDHNNGYATFYAHLDTIYAGVSPGEPVVKGQYLGEVGNTGCGDCREHLHFEVRYDPSAIWPITSVVDPYGWRGNGIDPASLSSLSFYPSVYLWEFAIETEEITDDTGGSIQDPTGAVETTFPPGAVWDSSTTFILQLTPSFLPPVDQETLQLKPTGQNSAYHSTGLSFNLYNPFWSIYDFGELVDITITYEPDDILLLEESSLVIAQWDESSNELIPLPTELDTLNNTAKTQTWATGRFELVGNPLCVNDAGEPNNNSGHAQETTYGLTHSGIFSYSADVDWWRFETTTGESYAIEVESTNSLLQAVVYDSNGDVVANGINSSKLIFTASGSGTAFVEVTSLATVTDCSTGYELLISQETTGGSIYLPVVLK